MGYTLRQIVFTSSILEYWLRCAAARDLGFRLAGAHAGNGFMDKFLGHAFKVYVCIVPEIYAA